MDELGAEETFGLVMTAEHLWTSCVAVLRTRIADSAWKTWFETAWPVEFHDGTFVLGVPNGVARERIEARYGELVRNVIGEVAGQTADLVIEVHTDVATVDIDRAVLGGPIDNVSRVQRRRHGARRGTAHARRAATESQVHASTRSSSARPTASPTPPRSRVAETPARSYNPLFIYGDAGLGKTHLLHAIGHYVARELPDAPCALRLHRDVPERVRRRHPHEHGQPTSSGATASVDVLLVDDIQFMESKEGLQEEFFHTFNALHGADRQIVLSSDRPPDAIATLEDRLRSRFKLGLITDIQPPELETRLAILRKKAERERTRDPAEVLEFIATHITNNIRELEGALIRVSRLRQPQPRAAHADAGRARARRHPRRHAAPARSRPQLILEATVGDVRLHRRGAQGQEPPPARSSPPARSACTSSGS